MKRGVLYATALLVLINLLALVFYLARAPKAPAVPTQEAPKQEVVPGQPGVYSVNGVVKELKPDGTNIVIRHEAIAGFMPAMTMPFTARDPRQIVALQPGDRIKFRLLVTADESWIDSVERITDGAPSPPPTFETAAARVVRDVEPLNIGDVMPDYAFTNQFGKPARFSDFRGKVVAVTFVFTRCPLPEFCPRMLKNFSAAVSALEKSTNAPAWHLLTLTIDPAFDTPEVLRLHAERYKYDPRQWTFLTGAMIDIDAITEQVGLVFRRQTSSALLDHNMRTLVVDPEGRLRKIFVGNTWKPEELVEEMAAAVKRNASPAEE